MIYLILKYMKSHIYELHALLAGILAFLLMFPVKKPVKKWLSAFTEKQCRKNRKWAQNKLTYRRRLGLSLIALDLLISAAVFCILARISPLIHDSIKTMWLSGFLSLTIYALYHQMFPGRKEEPHE